MSVWWPSAGPGPPDRHRSRPVPRGSGPILPNSLDRQAEPSHAEFAVACVGRCIGHAETGGRQCVGAGSAGRVRRSRGNSRCGRGRPGESDPTHQESGRHGADDPPSSSPPPRPRHRHRVFTLSDQGRSDGGENGLFPQASRPIGRCRHRPVTVACREHPVVAEPSHGDRTLRIRAGTVGAWPNWRWRTELLPSGPSPRPTTASGRDHR